MKLLNLGLVNRVSGGAVYEATDGTVIWDRMPKVYSNEFEYMIEKYKDELLLDYYNNQNKTIVEVW